MNKLYLDGNYIVADFNDSKGNLKRILFPRTNSYYDEEGLDSFILKRINTSKELIINFNDVSSWLDDLGTVYTEGSMRAFLRINTDFKAALAGSSAIKVSQIVDEHSLFVPGTVVGEIGYTTNSQGTQWLPGEFGGTYYPAGWYSWNGTDWVSDRNAIANQLENNLISLSQKADIVHTHEHSDIKNRTFEQFLQYIRSLDPLGKQVYEDSGGNEIPETDLVTQRERLIRVVYTWNSNTTNLNLNYNNNILTSLVLTGFVAPAINTTKTLVYDNNGTLISVQYS